MDTILNNLQIINDNNKDWLNFLNYYNKSDIAFHSLKVAYEAKNLAYIFDVNTLDAYTSGCLHDVGRIFSNDEMIDIADNLGLDIFLEEREYPYLLHQKLSSVLARDIFKVEKKVVLDAISCHTTLKKNPSNLDLVLFVSDKLCQENYFIKSKMNKALNISLESAAFVYFEYFLKNKKPNTILHPYFNESYEYLKNELN